MQNREISEQKTKQLAQKAQNQPKIQPMLGWGSLIEQISWRVKLIEKTSKHISSHAHTEMAVFTAEWLTMLH